jgi:hypothetical protein
MAGKGKKEKVVKEGLCALVREHGVFVKSHLIPQALTGHDTPGKHFIEAGRGFRPVKRFTSWYDDELVIRKGEDYLSDIDSRAVIELRKHKLVWSGWGKDKVLKCEHQRIASDTKEGFRALPNVDAQLLRVYFLSLLWRALSTNRVEFSHLKKEGVDLDRLREIIISGDAGRAAYHPVILHQMNTRGVTHNFTPVMWETVIPSSEQGPELKIETYRFYMQGLVAHVYPCIDRATADRMGGMVLGAGSNAFVFTRPFNSSAQMSRMKETARPYTNL